MPSNIWGTSASKNICFNPDTLVTNRANIFSPNIHKQILQTDLYTFL